MYQSGPQLQQSGPNFAQSGGPVQLNQSMSQGGLVMTTPQKSGSGALIAGLLVAFCALGGGGFAAYKVFGSHAAVAAQEAQPPANAAPPPAEPKPSTAAPKDAPPAAATAAPASSPAPSERCAGSDQLRRRCAVASRTGPRSRRRSDSSRRTSAQAERRTCCGRARRRPETGWRSLDRRRSLVQRSADGRVEDPALTADAEQDVAALRGGGDLSGARCVLAVRLEDHVAGFDAGAVGG